jgi:phospholipid/cholesterol/gamma-HCH transport system ATP-binding protein
VSGATDRPAIEVHGLINRFGTQTVHENLELTLPRGQIVGIVGGSGSGKSVLMRAILGLRPPQGGEIEVLGRAVTGIPDRDVHLRESSGVLFQDGALFSSLTVVENVEVPLKAHIRDLSPALRRQLATLKIRLVGLPAEACNKYPSELSGGMRKRAGLARALALDPDLLFLDEPTAGLDPISAADFDALLRTLQRALGLTVFLITHDLDTLYTICDQVAVIGERRVLTVGPLAEVEVFDHPWVQSYFHGPRGRAAHRQGPG